MGRALVAVRSTVAREVFTKQLGCSLTFALIIAFATSTSRHFVSAASSSARCTEAQPAVIPEQLLSCPDSCTICDVPSASLQLVACFKSGVCQTEQGRMVHFVLTKIDVVIKRYSESPCKPSFYIIADNDEKFLRKLAREIVNVSMWANDGRNRGRLCTHTFKPERDAAVTSPKESEPNGERTTPRAVLPHTRDATRQLQLSSSPTMLLTTYRPTLQIMDSTRETQKPDHRGISRHVANKGDSEQVSVHILVVSIPVTFVTAFISALALIKLCRKKRFPRWNKSLPLSVQIDVGGEVTTTCVAETDQWSTESATIQHMYGVSTAVHWDM